MVNNPEDKVTETNTTFPVTYLCHRCGQHFDFVSDRDMLRSDDLYDEAKAAHREDDGCDEPDLYGVSEGVPCVGYVNAYRVDQAYGGREEGGWYYDVGEPLASVPVRGKYLTQRRYDGQTFLRPIYDEERVSEIKREIKLVFDDSPETDRYGYYRGSRLAIHVESYMARAYPSRRPRYE